MKMMTALASAAALGLIALTATGVRADGPDGMPESILPPEDITIVGEGNEKWFLFQAEEDGILTLFTHNSSSDLVLEVYPENWEEGALGRVDGDLGHVGNEAAILEVAQGNVYYIRIAPFTGGAALPPRFCLLASFVEGATLERPYLGARGGQDYSFDDIIELPAGFDGQGSGIQIEPAEAGIHLYPGSR